MAHVLREDLHMTYLSFLDLGCISLAVRVAGRDESKAKGYGLHLAEIRFKIGSKR